MAPIQIVQNGWKKTGLLLKPQLQSQLGYITLPSTKHDTHFSLSVSTKLNVVPFRTTRIKKIAS